jgi:hypothetical protein
MAIQDRISFVPKEISHAWMIESLRFIDSLYMNYKRST